MVNALTRVAAALGTPATVKHVLPALEAVLGAREQHLPNVMAGANSAATGSMTDAEQGGTSGGGGEGGAFGNGNNGGGGGGGAGGSGVVVVVSARPRSPRRRRRP